MNNEDYVLSKLLSESLLPPPISTLGEQVHHSGYKFDDHIYEDEVELVCVLHGASYVGIDNQYIRIRKNDCLLIYPRATHNYFLKEDESCRMIDLVFKPGNLGIFDPFDLRFNMRFLYELLVPQVKFLRFLDNGEIKGTLERILFQYTHPDEPSRQMLLKVFFCELYVLLSRVISAARDELGKPKNQYVTSGLDYLVNFYNTQLTIEDVASHVGLSPRHFSRLFSTELGLTVPEYLSILRIKKAKDLLANSDLDVTRIAYNLGFNSSQYFITCFKNIEYITPGKYRQRVRPGA